MARQPRRDGPDTWHHVINRGIAKRPLFETRDDIRFFLARLARQIRLNRIEVHAYCIMTTHFHMLVRSPIGQLSEAMRRVQNEHSRRFNRRKRRDGALIRGRYFSRLIDCLRYRQTVVRYIDGNPVQAGIVKASGEYEFSSAAAYYGERFPRWLNRDWIASEVRSATGDKQLTANNYRSIFEVGDPRKLKDIGDFVEARIRNKGTRDLLNDLIGSTPDQVRAWMRRKAKLADGHTIGQPICGSRTLLQELGHLEMGELWMVEDGDQIRRGVDLARSGLLRDLCQLSWKEIAQFEKGSVARALRLAETHRRLLEENSDYAGRVAKLASRAMLRCT